MTNPHMSLVRGLKARIRELEHADAVALETLEGIPRNALKLLMCPAMRPGGAVECAIKRLKSAGIRPSNAPQTSMTILGHIPSPDEVEEWRVLFHAGFPEPKTSDFTFKYLAKRKELT